MRRPLIQQYQRRYGLPVAVKRVQADVRSLLLSPREGDVVQNIFRGGGGGGSGSGVPVDLQDAYDNGAGILVAGGDPIIITIGSLGNALHLGDNAQLFFGTGADAMIYYDGTDWVFKSNEVGSGDIEFWGGRQLQGFDGSPGSQTWVLDNADAQLGLGGLPSSSTALWTQFHIALSRDEQTLLGQRCTVTVITTTPSVGIGYAERLEVVQSSSEDLAGIAIVDWDLKHSGAGDIDQMWGFHGYLQSDAPGLGQVDESGGFILQGANSGAGDAWAGGVEPTYMYGMWVDDQDLQLGTTIFRGVDIRKQSGVSSSSFSVRAGDAIIADAQAEMRFEEATANGDNYVGFKAPASIGSNLIWTLPSADGAANTRLKTDGSGTLSFQQETTDITFVIDGGGSSITTGVKGDLVVDFAGTITGWTILGDQSGSIVVDVWKDTYANFPPTVADTIAGSEKPTISSATKGQDYSLSTWTTAIAAGDTIRFNVDSATTITRATLAIRVTKT